MFVFRPICSAVVYIIILKSFRVLHNIPIWWSQTKYVSVYIALLSLNLMQYSWQSNAADIEIEAEEEEEEIMNSPALSDHKELGRALKERDMEFTFDPLKRCCLHTYFKHLSLSEELLCVEPSTHIPPPALPSTYYT